MLFSIHPHVKVALDEVVFGPTIARPAAGTSLTQVNFRNAVPSDTCLIICIKRIMYLVTQQNHLSEVSKSCIKQEDLNSRSIKLRTLLNVCWRRPLRIFHDFLWL